MYLCIDILSGTFASACAGRFSDDRELQMAACYFLAEHALRSDGHAVAALTLKLQDDRPIHEYVHLNGGTCGSDYYVSACAAKALRALGASVPRADVPENCHEFWSPGASRCAGRA